MAKYDAAKKRQEDIDKAAEAKIKPIREDYEHKVAELEARVKAVTDREDAVVKKEEQLDARKNELDVRAATQEQEIEAARQEAKIAAEQEIRASEDSIREDEYLQLLQKGETKAKDIEKEAQAKLDTANREAQEVEKAALEKATQIQQGARDSIEHDRAEVTAALSGVAQKQAEANAAHERAVTAEVAAGEKLAAATEALHKSYEARFAVLDERVRDVASKRAELDLDREDLDDDREYLKQLKERYSAASPARVAELEESIQMLQQQISQLEQINSERSSIILQLQEQIARSMPADFAAYEQLKKDYDELMEAYSSQPSPAEIKALYQKADALVVVKAERDAEIERRVKAQTTLETVSFSQKELDATRLQAQALQALNEQLQKKLKFITDTYKSNRENKFAGLLELDDAFAGKRNKAAGQTISSLPALVEHVRQYGAARKDNPLYYSHKIIRAFIASLAASYKASRLLILQGLSGTGKSSLPLLFAESIGIDSFFVPVQPSWRDNRELLGYDNDFTNRFKETEFTKYLYRASQDQSRITLIVLDEMNLARIEYYFADFLSELENQKDSWTITLISNYVEQNPDERPQYLLCDGGSARLQVGKNVWFVGTANNDDSTATITDKVYDRAQILDMDERVVPFSVSGEAVVKPLQLATFETMIRQAQSNISNCLNDNDLKELSQLDDEYLKKMDITFGSRIETQLKQFVPVYVACGGSKAEAIDYYLAHKILRKLDERYDAYIADVLIELKAMLDLTYGEGSCEESIRKINTLLRRNFNRGENE